VPVAATPPVLNVIQVKYAERITQKSLVLHDYGQYGQPDGDLHMEYNFWIVRSADSTILLDTGYDVAARDWLARSACCRPPTAWTCWASTRRPSTW
jgi:hypothetical protein